MAVYETNDVGLPDFVCKHERVVVKFTGKACVVCQELSPVYLELSEKETYQHIQFLKLDAADNPIASKEVNQNGTPFIVAYRDGDLISHKLANSKNEMVTILDRLLL